MMALYSLALGAVLAMSAPWWLWRMGARPRYRQGLRERFGWVSRHVREAVHGRQVVWVHAVSVGEVLAVAPLVTALEAALAAQGGPDAWRVVVSSTTATGNALARDRFGAERVFPFPLDFAWPVRAWMRTLRPRLMVLTESELWPRLLAECESGRVPVAVVNARMSDRSFRRAQRVQRLWLRVLRRVSLFLAQSEETAQRLLALGADEGAVRVTGNLKYDVAPRESAVATALAPLLHRRCPVIAGSLLRGEEEILLSRWQRVVDAEPDAVLVLAPRHPERFEAVARLIETRFPLYRASALAARQPGADPPLWLDPRAVVLLDTVGDLPAVYGLGEVAFVGGSLVRKGGHNPLEPARFGVPVVMGPWFENFREIVGKMQAIGGLEVVRSADELAAALVRFLKDRVASDALGQKGMQVFERERGATERSVGALMALLREAGWRKAQR